MATANVPAISTYKTYLMSGASASALTKLIDIKEFPDIGGDPEMLETTTLSDSMQTFIMGIQSADAMEFVANYTPDKFQALKALEGQTKSYGIYFGSESGSMGKFTFDGQLNVRVNGGGVNEVVEMTVSIAPSTVITFAAGTSS